MRVAGRGYRDGVHNLEVMLESLSGGRRREIQEDGIVMEVTSLGTPNLHASQTVKKYGQIK